MLCAFFLNCVLISVVWSLQCGIRRNFLLFQKPPLFHQLIPYWRASEIAIVRSQTMLPFNCFIASTASSVSISANAKPLSLPAAASVVMALTEARWGYGVIHFFDFFMP